MKHRLLVAAVTLAAAHLAAAQSTSGLASRADPSADIFENGRIPRLEIAIEAQEMETLRRTPRGWVRATLREDGATLYKDVGIKLKGSFGSFRRVDDKPAFTIDVSRHEQGQEFHGLTKLYLNNSIQDPSYLREWIASEIFRGAGHPAARIGHARVLLNGRDLGLYVLKEGFDRRFLARFFDRPDGNFYDGGVNGELDTPLERDSGDGPEDRADLQAVAAACKEPDPALRWSSIARHVDVDAFVSFMALELMIGHWDGYTLNKNNYRVYFDPVSQQARFIPHGMDQVFDGRALSVFVRPRMLVSGAVMANPEWRRLYEKRLAELLPAFAPERLLPRIDAAYATLKPVVAATMDPEFARALAASVDGLKARVVERAGRLAEQIGTGEP
jgi:spore coat protein CotH